jgi:hypothetical protein
MTSPATRPALGAHLHHNCHRLPRQDCTQPQAQAQAASLGLRLALATSSEPGFQQLLDWASSV